MKRAELKITKEITTEASHILQRTQTTVFRG
jgi:hypothetical protein